MRDSARALTALAFVFLFGCGSNKSGSDPDAAPPGADAPTAPDADTTPDGPVTHCGDGVREPGEDCDDGNTEPDAECTANCKFTCGDGAVNFEEVCDIGIAAGATGACPTTCSDGNSCTTDLLSQPATCAAACVFTPITANTAGDGCCLPGRSSLDDTDCPVTCGNDVVEPPTETCDTGIPTGDGSCPTAPSCNDSNSCTTDRLDNGGTCTAACGHTNITLPANNDGCCPPGANNSTDNDCPVVAQCGNGRVDTNETCDTAIAQGQAGACPTVASCKDQVACTTDTLRNGGTCTAACGHVDITQPTHGDLCCPSGGNHNNDNDCPVTCGNGVIEPPTETCDDRNSNPNDGCHECRTVALPPTAFRFTRLTLLDPHTTVSVGFCFDVTNQNALPFAVNVKIAEAIAMDTDSDGFLDLSPLIVFRPLQQSQTSGPADVSIGDCTVPESGRRCAFRSSPVPAHATATNRSTGTCIGPTAGTTNGTYRPIITDTPAGSTGCFSTDPQTLRIELAGIPITLTSAQVGATYTSNPATGMINGMLRGFISEADANATILPGDLPLVGNKPLSLLLPGGDPPGTDRNCSNYSDKDTVNGVMGWWFYLGFDATQVGWSETPLPAPPLL